MLPSLRLPALLLALLASCAPASALTDEEENDAIVYAWDNAVFTLYHEVGHMFVDLYDLPVLAKEEDAVDNLATLMALDDYNRNDDPILIDAAAGWIAALREDDYSGMAASDFFDEHSVNAQRAYAMICILVGSDFKQFTEIATVFGLGKDRQKRCAADYRQTKKAWDRVMKPHAEPNKGKSRISIVYDEPGKATGDGAAILRDNEVLEAVAKTVEARYTLPKPVTFRGTDCGQDNAFYDSGNRQIIVCYELVENYYDAYRKGAAAGDPPSVAGGAQVSGDAVEGDTSDPSGWFESGHITLGGPARN